jgi:ABC-type antimicrobial peptide transport system permease subunit
VNIEKKNLHVGGILLSRGFGKKNLFLMIVNQIFIIFFLSICSGGIVGLLTGLIWTKSFLYTQIHYAWSGKMITPLFSIPIGLKYSEIGVLLGSIFVLTVILYLIFFLIQERKSISRLLIKF